MTRRKTFVLVLFALLASCGQPPERFRLVRISDSWALRMDTATGKTWKMRVTAEGVWNPVDEPLRFPASESK